MMEPVLAPCTLIVPTRHRRELLRETMASIAAGDTLPEEIVIVDQSDEPDEALPGLIERAYAERGVSGGGRTAIRYLPSETVGLSRAMNIALDAASRDTLVCTHDDVRVERDWLRVLLAAAQAGGPDEVLSGRVMPEAGEPDTFVPSTIENTEGAVYDRPQWSFDPLFPLNMAMHRSVPERIGGFDERLGPGTRYPGAEDNDFAYRALRAGIRIRYVPEAVVHHRAWRHTDEYAGLRWSYGLGQGAFFAKHATLRNPYGWGRLGRSLVKVVLLMPSRYARMGNRAFAEFANVAGIVTAFVRWKWTRGGGSPPGAGPPAGGAGQGTSASAGSESGPDSPSSRSTV